MKRALLCLALLFPALSLGAAETARLSAAEAQKRLAAGTAVLVDVREHGEWVATGVAGPAVLLAKSDFDAGERGDWKPFLEKNRGKQILLYCRTGHRAGVVAAALAKAGYDVANVGGFKDWESAGLPVRLVSETPAGKR